MRIHTSCKLSRRKCGIIRPFPMPWWSQSKNLLMANCYRQMRTNPISLPATQKPVILRDLSTIVQGDVNNHEKFNSFHHFSFPFKVASHIFCKNFWRAIGKLYVNITRYRLLGSSSHLKVLFVTIDKMLINVWVILHLLAK